MRVTVAKRVMVPAKGRSMAHQRHQEVVEVAAAAVVLQEHRDIFKCRTATDSNAHFRNRLMMSNALDFLSCEAGVRRRWPAPLESRERLSWGGAKRGWWRRMRAELSAAQTQRVTCGFSEVNSGAGAVLRTLIAVGKMKERGAGAGRRASSSSQAAETGAPKFVTSHATRHGKRRIHEEG